MDHVAIQVLGSLPTEQEQNAKRWFQNIVQYAYYTRANPATEPA